MRSPMQPSKQFARPQPTIPLSLPTAAAALIALMIVSPTPAAPPDKLAATDNWPRWRGPHDDGGNDRGAYPATWDAKSGALWKAPLPGKGCSTPIVWDRRIYLTAPAGGQDAVLAFNWAGKPLWQTKVGPQRLGKNKNGSGSNPSAATDGRGVFAYFKSGDLAAVDLDGNLRWKTNLQERYGKDTLYWDIGTSPVLTERDVVIAVLQHGGSYLGAFDKST